MFRKEIIVNKSNKEFANIVTNKSNKEFSILTFNKSNKEYKTISIDFTIGTLNDNLNYNLIFNL